MSIDTANVASFADLAGLSALRRRAAKGEEGSLEEAARQFEALLLGQMLRQMRDSQKVEGGLFDSPALDQYQQMMDQQLAQDLSRRGGIGLARFIVRQMSNPPEPQSTDEGKMAATGMGQGREAAPELPQEPEAFVHTLLPLARPAAERLGVEPAALVAQAALETGWGRHVMRLPDGRSSHNLFGIKAGPDWQGERVRVPTLEYRDGIARREMAEFRAYPDLEAAFNDYADFISGSPRYRAMLEAGGGRAWAEALQRAGYATDPQYAEKLVAILQRPELKNVPDDGSEA
ncbi:MAG: flagellar assembly peptidoglycan hydrolase FlgJ [Gammaproteobacteria bacterium]|nr:MAG: flagellar assembly peptidoglycan hydrolase FlgJ [Gammaproteobacteria bacterium]